MRIVLTTASVVLCAGRHTHQSKAWKWKWSVAGGGVETRSCGGI